MKAMISAITISPGAGELLTPPVVWNTPSLPDGKGHALYWFRPSEAEWLLVEVPGQRILYRVGGLNRVFWANGRVAMGARVKRHGGLFPGLGLNRIRLLREIPPIKAYAIYEYFVLDLEGRTARPASRELLRANGLSRSLPPQYMHLAEAEERGGKKVLTEWIPAAQTTPGARGTLRILLQDLQTGTATKVYEGSYAEGRNSAPVFVDDDTIFFAADLQTYRLTISTGKATPL